MKRQKDSLSSHMNKWIALSQDRKKILGIANDIKILDKKVKKSGVTNVIYHHMLPQDGSYSPLNGKD